MTPQEINGSQEKNTTTWSRCCRRGTAKDNHKYGLILVILVSLALRRGRPKVCTFFAGGHPLHFNMKAGAKSTTDRYHREGQGRRALFLGRRMAPSSRPRPPRPTEAAASRCPKKAFVPSSSPSGNKGTRHHFLPIYQY
jgi:hypothetical protein